MLIGPLPPPHLCTTALYRLPDYTSHHVAQSSPFIIQSSNTIILLVTVPPASPSLHLYTSSFSLSSTKPDDYVIIKHITVTDSHFKVTDHYIDWFACLPLCTSPPSTPWWLFPHLCRASFVSHTSQHQQLCACFHPPRDRWTPLLLLPWGEKITAAAAAAAGLSPPLPQSAALLPPRDRRYLSSVKRKLLFVYTPW